MTMTPFFILILYTPLHLSILFLFTVVGAKPSKTLNLAKQIISNKTDKKSFFAKQHFLFKNASSNKIAFSEIL